MENQELIPHLFRTEYRKITAVLSKTFGLEHIEIEQDIASDAQRNVFMRDGVVLSDKVVEQRLNAAREIENVTTSASDDAT